MTDRNSPNHRPADPVAAMVDAMTKDGIPPSDPTVVTPDGRLHRYHVDGDKHGSSNGWYVLHMDSVSAGAYGSWRTGTWHTWCDRPQSELSPAEREALRQRMVDAKAEFDERLRQQRVEAADKARYLWERARPADPAHDYLQAKQVPPLVARQLQDSLVLPLYDPETWAIVNLQFIAADGMKNFLGGARKKGCVIPVAHPEHWRRLVITEGWATGVSVAAMSPEALVLAGVDAYNLLPVAQAVRRHWPGAEIVIAGDAGPVGETQARNAASAVNGLVAIPPMIEDGADWNDYVNGGGRHV